MDAVVAQIQGLSSTVGDQAQLVTQLKAMPLAANAQAIPQALCELDPVAHGLGITILL